MQTNGELAQEFRAFCELVYKDAQHIVKQTRAGHTSEVDKAATQLVQAALTKLQDLLSAPGQENGEAKDEDALPAQGDTPGAGEAPFVVQVTSDVINAIDGPGEYMERERSVVLSVAEAQRLKREKPAIADYLNEEDPQHPRLLATTEQLTELGFSALAGQIDAEADRQVAERNLRRKLSSKADPFLNSPSSSNAVDG